MTPVGSPHHRHQVVVFAVGGVVGRAAASRRSAGRATAWPGRRAGLRLGGPGRRRRARPATAASAASGPGCGSPSGRPDRGDRVRHRRHTAAVGTGAADGLRAGFDPEVDAVTGHEGPAQPHRCVLDEGVEGTGRHLDGVQTNVPHGDSCTHHSFRAATATIDSSEKIGRRRAPTVSRVETMGLEPTTPTLQRWCATNCATSPGRPHVTGGGPAR